MKHILKPLLNFSILFILFVVYYDVSAQCEENQLTGKSPAGVSSFYMGQSFTAGCDGQVVRVAIFSAVNDSAVGGLLRIYDTSTVNTTPAYTQSFDGFVVEIDSPAWIALDIPFPVKQNEEYAFEYYASFEPQAQIFGAELYPGGFAFVGGVENPRVDFRFIVEIDPATGMSKYNSSTELSLYPNPATSQLQVEKPSTFSSPSEVAIYDLSGRLYWQEEHAGAAPISISTASFPDGLYVITVSGTESGEFASATFSVVRP